MQVKVARGGDAYGACCVLASGIGPGVVHGPNPLRGVEHIADLARLVQVPASQPQRSDDRSHAACIYASISRPACSSPRQPAATVACLGLRLRQPANRVKWPERTMCRGASKAVATESTGLCGVSRGSNAIGVSSHPYAFWLCGVTRTLVSRTCTPGPPRSRRRSASASAARGRSATNRLSHDATRLSHVARLLHVVGASGTMLNPDCWRGQPLLLRRTGLGHVGVGVVSCAQ